MEKKKRKPRVTAGAQSSGRVKPLEPPEDYGDPITEDAPPKPPKKKGHNNKAQEWDPNNTPFNKRPGNYAPGTASKLTPEVEKKIINVLSIGGYLDDACAFAGVTYQTFRKWIKAGARGQPGYAEFVQKIHQARATFQIESLGRIREAGMGEEHVHETVDPKTGKVIERKVVKGKGKQWTADAWRLERLRPHKYGQRNQDAQYVQKMVQESFMKLVKAFSGVNNEHLQRALEALAAPDVGDESAGFDSLLEAAGDTPRLD